MKTLKEAILLGEATPSDIDDWVDQWHDGYSDKEKLHDHLGMNRGEYPNWVTNPSELLLVSGVWCTTSRKFGESNEES